MSYEQHGPPIEKKRLHGERPEQDAADSRPAKETQSVHELVCEYTQGSKLQPDHEAEQVADALRKPERESDGSGEAVDVHDEESVVRKPGQLTPWQRHARQGRERERKCGLSEYCGWMSATVPQAREDLTEG